MAGGFRRCRCLTPRHDSVSSRRLIEPDMQFSRIRLSDEIMPAPTESSSCAALEHAQRIAGHASPKTTKLYDRTADTITLDEIERIVI